MIQLKNLDLAIAGGDYEIFIYEIYDKSYSFISYFKFEKEFYKLIKSINGNLISLSNCIQIYNKKNKNNILSLVVSKFKSLTKNILPIKETKII